MSTEQPRRFLSTADLADLSGLSISTIDRRVKDGSIPAIQPGGPGKRKLFSRDVLDQLASPPPLPSSPPPTTSTPSESAQNHDNAPARLPGPRPKWQSSLSNEAR